MEKQIEDGQSQDSKALKTTYAKWQQEEGIPIHRNFWVDL
jgi:hypothetical protein